MNLTVTPSGTFSIIRPEGRLTATGAPRLRQQIDDLVAAGTPRIVIDLSATEFIDSSALGAIIGGLKSTRGAGGDLRIATATEPVRRVLKLTNLDRVLREYDAAEEAFDD